MKRLVNKILLLMLLGTSLTLAQALYFPTNVRYIGGGYINKQPYFNSLNQALNNVKAFATPSNPYIFQLDSDTLYIADWDSVYNKGVNMVDSINIYYVNPGYIKWGGLIGGGSSQTFPTTIPTTTLQTQYYKFPKWDATVSPAWQDSLSQALDSIDYQINNLVVYTGPYLSIKNDTLVIDTVGLASSFGILQGQVTAGTGNFVGQDTMVTIFVTGSTTSDIYIFQPIYSNTTTAENANDVLYWVKATGGFIVKRKAGGTANLNFGFIRYKY